MLSYCKPYKEDTYMSQMLLLDKRTQGLIEDYVPQGEILEGVVCFFSVFADYTRVKILSALAISEMCVTDLSRILEINQTTVSHQLRFLKSAGIVKSCRQGKIVFYSLVDDGINDVILKGIEFLGC
ncbi:MAG: winged helix-turn-helix transcriptional regulator [Clostridia bacterium]|nr:winged helix-turn-helix transcriptional regulator [Clostridia bacterium]